MPRVGVDHEQVGVMRVTRRDAAPDYPRRQPVLHADAADLGGAGEVVRDDEDAGHESSRGTGHGPLFDASNTHWQAAHEHRVVSDECITGQSAYRGEGVSPSRIAARA